MEVFSIDKLQEALGGEPLSPGTRKAVELAYLLSTQTLEGRPLRFAFLFADHATFSPERKLDPIVTGGEDIRRLCLATDPAENCWRIQYDEAKDDISVIGVANMPPEVAASLPSYFDETVIEVDGTACVSVRIGNTRRARYWRSEHFVPNVEEILPTLIPSSVVETIARKCFTPSPLPKDAPFIPFGQDAGTPLHKESYLANKEKYEATTREVAQATVAPVIRLALRRMQELQHGGCLILTNEEHPANPFDPSYRLDRREGGFSRAGYNWAYLAYVQAATHLLLARRDNLVILKDLKDRPLDYAQLVLENLHYKLYDREAARYARLWAQLSVIDGMVVMNHLLEPLVFGGITTVPDSFKGLKGKKGARHQAGAYAATRFPGSVAIVVSQDGSVTAYRKKADSDDEVEAIKLRL